MSFWTAAVIIVAIWGFVQIVTRRNDRHLGVSRDEDGNPVFPPREDSATRREIEDLRERIKTLEKITVDGREAKAIADEIERLRDR